MSGKKTLWLLTLAGLFLLAGANGLGPGPGIFPRRRSSNDGMMQSRAVDTRVQFEVLEGEPKGTVVGYIPTKPGFTYRFNEPPREFILDSNTGEIRTNAVLDRESLSNDRYDLVILSSQPTYPIEVRILVQDINDNAPEFPERVISVSFSESSGSGTRLLLDAATDRDSGINKVTDDYRIVNGNYDEKFRLAVTTNPSGDVSYLHLETTGKLDRETRGFYILNISARDGGDPPRYGYLQVNVTILDVNDNPPIFDHSDYIVSLNESVTPGTPVLQVMASDSDLGDNAKITYYLSDTEQQFTVDPETGVISTTEQLSCPQQNCPTYTRPGGSCPKSCVFTVFARDHGSPRQDGRTYVTVNLVDTNDHAPIIKFQYFPPTGTFATVDENAINGSVVAAVSVVDMDEGLNGETMLRIISGNELQHFRLEKTPSFDIVRVNGILDREEIGKYNLTLVAVDKGNPPRSAISHLIIHVNDVNDHDPSFEKSEYSAILSELAPPGTFVASITATDEDTGVNAQIFYDFVSGNNKQWFAIDSMSGLITTKSALDRELQGSVELSISARDGGPNPKWAYTQLKVTILDENDEAPQFSQSHIHVSLNENTNPNTLVAMLTASDHDQGTNGSVSYYLHPNVEVNYPNMFALDTLTGQLTIKNKLDREEMSKYEIQVIAKDQGIPQKSSTATVTLTVEDVNDNSPEFYPKQYFVAVPDDAPVGMSVLKVFATDRDDGENAIITYTLESGTEGHFVIDNWTGLISVKTSLRGSQKSLFKLVVSAKDRGDRKTEHNAMVEIVKESKMEELEFEMHDSYDFQINEDFGTKNPKIGREVGRTKISSSNASPYAIEYAIVLGDPNGNFKIDERTGLITTANIIDREITATYSLTIVAKSGIAYGKTIVNISVQDLNDNTPIFAQDRDEIHLLENAAVGQEVYLSRARDKDSGVNSRISYNLTYNPNDQFRLSESSGVLYLNRPIRSEPGTILQIEITATDGGEIPLSSKNTIKIIIEDVNDHTPVFDHTSYETSLLESTPVNARFFALAASDIDLGDNGKISYEIIEGNVENKFGIFPDGYLYVKSPMDRETRDYYSLTVTCTDGGQPPRSSEVPVIIHVIDENDNSPEFTNTTFTFSVAENEPIDTFVGKLTATDRDIGRNAELIFMLSNVQNDFTIDPRNGFIKTGRVFDREALVQTTGQNFYTLEAIVSDNGIVRLRDKVKVKIFITDVNDNAPKFLRAPYKIQVSEGSSVGSQLIRVYTFDADDGLNGDVYYSISEGNDEEKFSIDDSTGQLILAKKLDRETVSFYKLTIVAHDAALRNRLNSTTTISIEVLDENDDAPEFVQTDSKISVMETTPIGTELIKFRASDSDLGVNSQITYSIAAGNKRETFHIDPVSGSLYLHKMLDYEDTQTYYLNITASDGGNPRLTTAVSFIVNVLDSNDNPPNFPNTAIVRQIKEGIPINTPIVTITAEDPDSGLNGKIMYSIQNQDPSFGQPHFGINPSTGVIHTLREIDRETVDTFKLTVIATDQAPVESLRLSAEKLVTVIVEDINDNAPVFVSMNSAVLPLDNFRVDPGKDGHMIMTVFARDADSSSNGLVTYELVSGNSQLFSLHRTTGVILLRRTIENPEPRYKLAVKATDEAVQSERKSSDAYITIISRSTCKNGPIFEQSGAMGSVYENEPVGTSILTVRTNYATDSEIEFYVTNVTGNGKQVDRLFDIDTKLGILSTAVELDRENGIDLYEIEVYAIVVGGLPCTSSIKVKVKVMDKNDSPPVFRDLSQVFMVSEDLGVGQVVANIRAHDPDTIGKLEYELVSGSDEKFLLDKFDGTLKLKDTLDRETKDSYKLLIRVTDGVQSTETTITIQVTDTNDNPPYFSEPAYSFDIPENAPRGYQVGLIAATDPDLGANSLLSYTVISDWANDVFSLNPQTGVFTLTARLDYEEVQHYILVVQAQDNGHPSLSSTVTVYCNVVDLNDNSPVFDPMSYSNEIFENVAIGTEVVTVSATDTDSGLNGQVSYSITAGDENEDFEILPNGTIYTKQLLDRETKSVYNLIITAKDRAENPEKQLSSTAQVTINLKDVNDMAPEFVTSNQTSVSEGTPLNTVIMAIKAVDRDEGRNGYVEYTLNMDSSVPPFTLGPVDGLLRVSGRLDRETTSSYQLTVTAKDRGEPPKFTKTKITVKILDENDNSPIFDPKQYSASVAENASIGASVLQVSATDIDEGSNGRIRYSIASGDENRDFSISEDSGIVRVAKNLNYERKNRYVLTIRAEDCAGDVNSGETRFDVAELVITISDINDNAPTFLDSPYLAYVMENVIPNEGYILTVKAYDADTPPFNSQVRYFLKEGDADLFRINASTGEISLLRALDREKQAEYILTLVAMDTGSPPLTGTGTVRVIVQDMNDHSPEFERQFYQKNVPENSPIGTKVLTPIVTDKDIGLNSLIRFSLLGDKVERFNIDHETGQISTAAILDREDVSTYYFTLMAQDSSVTEPRAAAVNLTIKINDINDNVPSFEQSTYVIYVPDRIKPGQFVFGAKAIDHDEGANGKISYSISGKDAGRFIIDTNTGVIKTYEELSINGPNSDKSFNVIIHATDHGYESKSAKCELSIILKPAHQFPSFSYISDTQFLLPEDVPQGKVVTKITATSPKKGPVATIKYAIAGGNINDALNIEASSGEVTIGRGGLDYETSHQYEVWIEASDSDHPSLRSVIKLLINVTDSNDNAPVMGKLLYQAEVLEEEAPPQTIIKVSATDADSDENGQVTYRLVNDFESAFEIDSDTGEIFTNMRLDREDIASYELTVEAVDQGMPQLSGVATVIVNVLDKNDNPPRFTRLFSVNVTENADIGAFVIKITSSDLDIGENANATYSFTENPGNKFHIDSITGNVTVAGRLDREQQDEYLLKVVAVDGAWRQETPLTITIQDQNDNAPEFEHSYYSFNFPELQRNIAFVGQVSATDRDKVGPNSVISYSLQHPNDLFTIDPATGEIFSKRAIHYKRSQMESSPENMYSLTVLATDNGKPPMYSECLVNVNIVDANNNPPKFEQKEYLSPVPEEAQVGQRLLQVIARDDYDFGVNAEVEYIITGGNGSNHFNVNKNDGWISVGKLLASAPGATFILNIRAIDKGVPPQYDDVEVTVVVTGENKFSPVFTALSYQVIVPENEPIGSTILIVSATDNDDGPNGMVRYSISGGNERKEFSVDAVSGTVTILQPLDYDSIQEYHLNITAEDLAFRPKSAVAMLRITLTDINDNAPVFNQTEYHANIAENSPVNSFVYRAIANDKDSPKNAIIQYAIEGGSGKDLFSIEPSTGIIKSKVIFDYEEKSLYDIIVTASNPDSQMFGKARIVVHITGVNEFYPKFLQSVFHFDISESAEVGTIVGSIQASDKDSGDDGKVYYLLVGSSNDKGFIINSKTGRISVARNLDRETQSRVVLTVMAKNFGGIRGNDTDEAQVIISIQDGNDPPEFVSKFYEASISEGAVIGTKVVTVKAVDKDVRPLNNQFSYTIIGGNIDHSFKIDPQNGNIETARNLDRETIPTYSLIVGAIDTGSPPQTGTTSVKITVNDINDNGPTFHPNNLKGVVYENEPANTSIMTLSATDPDLPPNGAPFSYYLIGGKHKSLVSIEKHSGVMKTTRMIDRETTPQLEIIVEVEDNGKPQMRSQHKVIVNVLDQNDSPSIPRVAHALVYNFNDKMPIGKIADVHPSDPDITGNYKCSILNGASKTNFVNSLTIPQGCDLYTTVNTKLQGYSLSVSGNDGKHPDVISTISVEFSNFYNKTVENSIAITIDNITSSNFLQNYYRSFLDILKATLDNGDDLILYSMKELNKNVEIFVAVKHVTGYRTSSYILDRIRKKRDALSQLVSSKLVIGYSPCNATTCNNGGTCTDKINVKNGLQIIDSPNFIFTSPLVVYEFTCKCVEGHTGKHCEKRQNPCTPNPCQAGGECRQQGYDFQCTCPPNREGKVCQLERSDACSNNPCKNGGSCRESSDGSSFFCLCRPGYRGNQCETIADSCRPNPCLYGGLCVSLKPGYKCSCVDGRYGRHCERATYGFQELSYMSFSALDSATNDISIIFATTKPDALLIYNYGVQSGGRSDFVSIEIISGKAVFSYGGARTAITSIVVDKSSNDSVSDGKWHKITATRNGKVMSLSIAKCADNGDSCEDCRPGDKMCYANEIGPAGTLNFNKHPLLIGGLLSADPVLERPGQVHSDDFIGCVHSVSVNGKMLNLSNPIKSRGIQPTCNRNNNGGACSQGHPDDPALSLCGTSGTCMDRWSTAICKCGSNLLAPDCYTSIEPISLIEGGFIEFRISEKHRRIQLLEHLYGYTNSWNDNPQNYNTFLMRMSHNETDYDTKSFPKSMSLMFRTVKENGLVFYSATNKHYTLIELRKGKIHYSSKQNTQINMTLSRSEYLANGKWHNITLVSLGRIAKIMIDGKVYGDELDASIIHDFLDPYLTVLSIGGIRRELYPKESNPVSFEGCITNFTINNEIQPFNGSGSIFKEVLQRGKVFLGCHSLTGLVESPVTDPLNIGITLVIVFFVILLVAIFASFIVFRLRKQHKEKDGGASPLHSKQNGTSTLLGGAGLVSSGGSVDMGRGLHVSDLSGVGFHSDNNDVLRGVGHHLVGPELISKKYKEREISNNEPQRPQRPDIIEREVVSKSPPPLREDLHPPLPPPSQSHHQHDHLGNIDQGSEFPEHYDLENASSIAPSDIDIVYHYKGYREAGNVRKYKATPPPVSSYTHHKHQSAAAQQHRHSPHHAGPYTPRVPPQSSQPPSSNTPRPHQSTPLARLSPSSELSSQQPRILTLHDISGKPLQSALLATTSSGVGKDVLHSNSERSLNSPVMSQLSGQSSSTSRKNPSAPQKNVQSVGPVPMGLTAEEIERMNARPRTSSLVSTLDAVSSSSEAPRVPGPHLAHMHHSPVVDAHSSTSSDESGNDSFTCSEIEYDNNSVNGDKYPKPEERSGSGNINENSASSSGKPMIPPPSYDGFDSSFRGSLSTLVASDDDLSTHMGGMYRQPNGTTSPSTSTLGWDYLLNWGPNFESLIGVFKDIAELPDTVNVNGRVIPSSLRIPASVQNPSEEYV